jgi:phytoene synthase
VRDRDLVRLYWPAELRPAFDALLDIDDAMGDVVMRASQPALAAIKLAWWRERLEELDNGKVPAEPRLVAAARELLPRGVSGADLAKLEAGWAAILQEVPDQEAALERGNELFALASTLLRERLPERSTGRLFAAGSLRRRGMAVDADELAKTLSIPRSLRPLTALAALAKRDLLRVEPEATPGRAWALLKHRLTGRI